MAYIGRQLVRGQNRIYDDISSSFNGSTTAFNLTVGGDATPPAQVNQLWIILGGILQKPGTDFTVADAQVTFTTAPAAGLDFWAMIQGDTSDMNAPSDGSVTPTKIATSGDFAFPADVRFKDADGSHYVGLQAPTTVSSNLVWTLPAADGSANQILKTNGSGVLGWATDSATDSTKLPLAGGTLTGNLTISNTAPSIIFTDTDHDSDFTVYGSSGSFTIRDVTNSVNRFNIASDGTVSLTNDLSIADKIIHTGDTNTAVRFPAADTITFETSGSERLRIDSSGSLGIGTTPETDGQANSLYFANGNANLWGSGNVNFYTCVNARYTGSAWKYNNTAAASYVGQQSGVWNFFNAPSGTADAAVTFTERFRIDSNGNVGIGETSPDELLHLKATATPSIELEQDDGTSYKALVQLRGNDLEIRGSSGQIEFYQGNADGASSSEKFRISSHGGVTFNGDTAAANCLDDYEEGTWTPAVNNGVSNTQQFDAVGNYTKIGNRVYCQFLLQWSGQGNGNRVQFQGLPFTSVSTNAVGGGTCIWTNVTGLTEWSQISLLAKRDDTIIECYRDGNSNATTGDSFTNKAFYGILEYMA